MKFAIRPLAMTCAILWGGAVFLCGMANMIWHPYAEVFLQMLDSAYPGYEAGGGFGSVVVGSLYAFLDGAVGGLLFGLLYNFLVSKCSCNACPTPAE